jgi:hypothetical protein
MNFPLKTVTSSVCGTEGRQASQLVNVPSFSSSTVYHHTDSNVCTVLVCPSARKSSVDLIC